MTCPECGRWAPADRATGYDTDDYCSAECKVAAEAREDQVRRFEECLDKWLDSVDTDLEHADRAAEILRSNAWRNS